MIKPTIHIGGTSREELARQFSEAAQAMRAAITALSEAAPNARDYMTSPDGGVRWAHVTREHSERDEALRKILRELEELQRHVADS